MLKNGSDDELKTHSVSDLTIPRNGYLYIYVSNETPNVDVIFDNLQVTHSRGPLVEETHYYPFGLTMAGISSKAAGKMENRFKYNGNKLESGEFSDGSGLEMYDFNARTYNQQLGRFMQIDPLSDEEEQESWNPYHFGFNNPILNADPDGKNPIAVYRILRGLYLLTKLSQEQGRVAPASMIPSLVRDNTIVRSTLLPIKVLNSTKADTENKTNEKAEQPKGGTYLLKDDEGNVQRTGRTNDLERRQKEHKKNEKTDDLEFEVDRRTDDKAAQRGREQLIHEKYSPPLNKIKPIRDNNPKKQEYLDAAKEIEKRLKQESEKPKS